MIDIFDDELTQMDENEAWIEPKIPAAIQLKDPIRTLAKKSITRSEDKSLDEILKSFQKNSTSCVVLTRDKKVSGIFTERDIVLNVLGKKLNFKESIIRNFMTPDPHTLRMGDPISFALNMMVDGGFRHIPIVDKKNHPKGMISILDIVEHLGHVFHEEIMNLPPKPLRKQSKQEGG
jgi:CBS domain-containing protein|tara:strand:+ start:37 stop:567 length:531 start_codon:yes stop_codon:yes gene_type:complete